jgi:murein DD-endopeptidase MepM/ murein hydrolase activator NlpD
VIAPVTKSTDRQRMEVSTLTREGEKDVVRMTPFMHVKMALAGGHTTTRAYPRFDPFTIFASAPEKGDNEAPASQIYGANVGSDLSLQTVDFPVDAQAFDTASALSLTEVEEAVRSTGAILTDGDVKVAALHYVDPERFGTDAVTDALNGNFGVRIVQENVSVAPRSRVGGDGASVFSEELIPFRETRKIATALAEAGFDGAGTDGMGEALGKILSTGSLKSGHFLRLGVETTGEDAVIVRASVYNSKEHLVTIAVDDRGQFVAADEPELNPAVASIFDNTPRPVRVRSELPSVYDGIYRAAYSYGLTDTMAAQLVKLLASEVDFQARLQPSDQIEMVFSDPGEDDSATEESDMLAIHTSFGGAKRSFYRFRTKDGNIDYFDENGRSARQFLLRNPVPTGTFRSGFGGRRHPILGYVKMHTGVDWSAPPGTPIISAGSGIVEKAGWSGGYGKQTIIRHTNGYTTSYSHQSQIAQGVVPGARIRQGQLIGYVGSTGLSTGPHLHYELIVNGNKVDPMRVRLPTSKVLDGEEFAEFMRERSRIDQLIREENAEKPLKVANSETQASLRTTP